MSLRDGLLCKDKETVMGLTTRAVEAVRSTDVC